MNQPVMKKPEIQVVAEAFRGEALRIQHLCKVLKGIGIGLSIVAMFIAQAPAILGLPEDLLEWVLVILALVFQVVAEYLFNNGRKAHFNARDGYRWFLLTNAVSDDQTKANVPLDDLKQKAIHLVLRPGADIAKGKYFFSTAAPGWKRLLENLYESVYFTKAIMEIQHVRKMRWLILMVVIIVVSLVAILTIHTEHDPVDPYLISLAMISLGVPLVIDLLHMSRAKFALEELGRMQERMKAFLGKTHEQLGADLSILMDMAAKYYSITVEQEVLSKRVYNKYNEVLTENYAAHITPLTD